MRQIHSGGNWTSVDLRGALSDVTREEALTRIASCHTIVEYLFHVNYYVRAVTAVLRGGPLDASDAVAYDHPPIETDVQWDHMVEQAVRDGDVFADLIETLPDDVLDTAFIDEKYGTYRRNLHGIIEHMHYHLGQIVLLKKLIRSA